jgi:hypothetical protein
MFVKKITALRKAAYATTRTEGCLDCFFGGYPQIVSPKNKCFMHEQLLSIFQYMTV